MPKVRLNYDGWLALPEAVHHELDLATGDHDGRKYRMLNVIDEFTRECLAIRVDHLVGAGQPRA